MFPNVPNLRLVDSLANIRLGSGETFRMWLKSPSWLNLGSLSCSVLCDVITQAARTARNQASIRSSLPQASSSAGSGSSADALSLLGSLKDAVGMANQKSKPKLGKEVLRGLESRLRAVAKGEDPK